MLWIQLLFTEEVASMLSIQEDKCEIKLVSVPVPRNSDPNVIYWPSCVKLDQCSGCCNNEILECVPTGVQGVEMQVLLRLMRSVFCSRLHCLASLRLFVCAYGVLRRTLF